MSKKRKPTKGILIDAKNNKLSYVEINDHTDISKHGGYNYFDVVHLSGKDDIYVDDEGLINGTQYGFEVLNPRKFNVAVYFGNGVVLGHNGHGDSIDCSLTIEQVSKQIRCFQTVANTPVWFAKNPVIA
jgi:hypothetical protein